MPIAATLSYIVQKTDIESLFLLHLEKGHTENAANEVFTIELRPKLTKVLFSAK